MKTTKEKLQIVLRTTKIHNLKRRNSEVRKYKTPEDLIHAAYTCSTKFLSEGIKNEKIIRTVVLYDDTLVIEQYSEHDSVTHIRILAYIKEFNISINCTLYDRPFSTQILCSGYYQVLQQKYPEYNKSICTSKNADEIYDLYRDELYTLIDKSV